MHNQAVRALLQLPICAAEDQHLQELQAQSCDAADSPRQMSLVTDREALKPVVALQETRSSAIWKPDPVMQSNVELTNGRPDFEAILKDIQVSPCSTARSLACLHDWQAPRSLRGGHQACIP